VKLSARRLPGRLLHATSLAFPAIPWLKAADQPLPGTALYLAFCVGAFPLTVPRVNRLAERHEGPITSGYRDSAVRKTQKSRLAGNYPARRPFKHFLCSTQFFRSQIVDVVAGVGPALAKLNRTFIRIFYSATSALPRHRRGPFGIPFFLKSGFERVEIVIAVP
jgi:hypothetical protein